MAQPAALLRCLLLLALVWRSTAQASTQLSVAFPTYETNMLAWYDAANFTAPSTWPARKGTQVNFGGSTTSFVGVDQADPTGAAGNNQCPVTYVSGVFTPGSPAGTGSTMIFGPSYSSDYPSATAFTFCSVTRYTSAQSTGRILQGVDGANCECRLPRRAAPHRTACGLF